MTVPSETNRSGPYNGNGSTTVFDYQFRIVDEDHLKVIKTSALGVETILTIDTDYVVSDVGEAAGGQVACTVAPAVGETITILRNVPFVQETDLENQGAYYAETVEDALDLAAMRDQQLSEEIERAVRVPASIATGTDLQLPAPEAGKIIAWNETADGLQNLSPEELSSVVAYGTANADIFTGDGVTTVFSLSDNPAAINNLDVAIGGVTQLPGTDYTWSSGTNLTFTTAPANGVKILVRYMQALAQGGTDADLVSTDPFTGAIIPDGSNAQEAFQALETAVELRETAAFSNSDSYTAATVRKKLQQHKNPLDAPYNATGDGATNDRTALFNADAAGPIVITANHRVSSNLTFTNHVRFAGNGRLTVDSGVTVTFTYQPDAPDRQIFYSTGSVAGLMISKAIWFAGDYLNTTTDALTLLQKGADACVSSGFYHFPTGFFTITGATAITLSKGQKVEGNGPFTSEIRYTGLASNVFNFTTTIYPSVKGMSFNTTNASPPTSGTVINFAVSYGKWENIAIRASSTGIAVNSSTVGHKGHNFEIFDAMSIGLQADSVNDVFISQFEISAPNDWITMTSVSGTFVAGETVTGGTSGATGTVTQVVSSTVLRVQVSAINFTGTETITGGTSGATGSFSVQTTPHALGGIRLTNKVEAFIAEGGDIIGGSYSMTTDATVYGLGTRPAYNKFTDVYFDSADNGALIDKVVEFDFISCWFSNRPNNGVNISNSDGVRFTGGGAINCYNNGAVVNATAVRTVFKGFAARGNSVRTANTYHGIAIAANTTDFIIQGCTLGGAIGFGTQAYGVLVNAGTSDRYIIADNLASGNGTGTVADGGTGVNKRVANNY